MSDTRQIEAPSEIVNLDKVVWLRTEYQGRWDLVVSREEQAKILGCTVALVSTRYGNYAEESPRPVVKYGTRKWMLRSEVEDFAQWIEDKRDESPGKNKGKKIERSVREKACADIVRLNRRLDQLEDQKAKLNVRVREKNAEIQQVKAQILVREQLRDSSK